MPNPYPSPLPGHIIRNQPTGFPLFYTKRQPRIITSNPFAFLKHLAKTSLNVTQSSKAIALIEQASDFNEAAKNPRIGSRPLLYYYSFMNLAKAALIIRGVPISASAHHGIYDPKRNIRSRLNLSGQNIHIKPYDGKHTEIFPELLKYLGTTLTSEKHFGVLDLLSLLPCVQRTYSLVCKMPSIYFPIDAIQVMRGRNQIWIHISFKRRDNEISTVLSRIQNRREFVSLFHQVAPPSNSDNICFETDPVPAKGQATDKSIKTLATRMESICVSSIFTRQGYRYYFCDIPKNMRIPTIAAGYAVMFYLGSVTRYKPDDFDKIIAGGYSWIVDEFITIFPMQFIYTLSSLLAGVDVVYPYAVTY
jgi:hypothetical protein